jgi:hypothetical protein
MVEAGMTYKATILSNTIGVSKSGKEYVKIVVEIQPGVTMPIMLWCTDNARKRTALSLEICGFDLEKDAAWELVENPHKLAGRMIDIEVSEQEFQGRKSLQANILLERPVTKAEVEKIGKNLLDAKNKKKGPNTEVQIGRNDDDEVPF